MANLVYSERLQKKDKHAFIEERFLGSFSTF